MTDEQKKKAEETAKAEAEAKAKEKEQADANFEAEIADLTDEEKEAKRAERDAQNSDNTPDYKAIAEEEKQKRLDAEKALAEKRFKSAERKRKDQEDDEDDPEDEDDKPITGRQLKDILAENTQRTEKRLMGSQIKKIADDLADSTDEAEAIIEVHANRTWPSHISLEEQLEEAHAIVNRKRVKSTTAELKRALKSKDTASRGGDEGHRDQMEGSTPKIEPSLERSLKAQKFEFDTKAKIWKKKLPNGKVLCKDFRSKPSKTWVV